MVPSNLSNRKISEQALIVALQAVANYPESRNFVELVPALTVSRTLPGVQTLLDTPVQPEGCMLSIQGPGSSVVAHRALSPVPNEELGIDCTSPHELAGAPNHNDSPTSRLPPDKQRQSDATPRSV